MKKKHAKAIRLAENHLTPSDTEKVMRFFFWLASRQHHNREVCSFLGNSRNFIGPSFVDLFIDGVV